ncbi:MAG: hypothetical protein JJ902_23545 [Roseibium sp.]|nr:hypothetical protein [Roseibium sp.]
MHLATTARDLRLALEPFKKLVSGRSTIPILATVRIGNGEIRGTDLDQWLSVKLAATELSGSLCVPFHRLLQIARNLPPAASLTLSSHGSAKTGFGAVLAFDGGRYLLPSIASHDFPDAPKVDGPLKALPDTFLPGLDACAPFISTEETRYYLNGICLSKDPAAQGVLVSTDGHRLAAHPCAHRVDGNPILPRCAVETLRGLPPAGKAVFSETRAAFQLPGARFVTRLIDGGFPDWHRVVPKPAANAPRLCFDPADLDRLLRRLSGLSSDAGGSLEIAAKGDLVTLTRISAGPGDEGVERLDSGSCDNWPEGGATWSFRARYLKDICRLHKGADRVRVTAKDFGSPAHITAEGRKTLTVLMPMRSDDSQAARESLTALARPAPAEAA